MSFEKSPISHLIKNMAGVRMVVFFHLNLYNQSNYDDLRCFDEFWKVTHHSFKQITYSHLISRFFHISTANYSIITPESCFSNIYNKRQNNLNFEYQAKMHPISWASFIRAGNIFERDDVHILLNGKVINLCYMSLNTYNRECTLNPLPEGIISRRYQSVNEHWKLHF